MMEVKKKKNKKGTSDMTKRILLYVMLVGVMILSACGSNNNDYLDDEEEEDLNLNVELPEVKGYESTINKEDINIVEDIGDWDNPAMSGEFINLKGKLHMERYGSNEGEMSLGIKRVLRGDAAKYRVRDDLREDIKKNREWITIEVVVYNWGIEGKDKLVFLEDDFKLYTGDKKEVKIVDVSNENDYKRVAVYEGKEEVVTITAKVKKESEVILSINKLFEEKEDGEEENKGNNEEEEEIEKDEDGTEIVTESVLDDKVEFYLNTDSVYTVEEFNVVEDSDGKDLEDLSKEQEDIEKEKEDKNEKDKESKDSKKDKEDKESKGNKKEKSKENKEDKETKEINKQE